MTEKEILYDVKDYVATITINRPKVLNAFTGDNVKEIQTLQTKATNDGKVGVIVLTNADDGNPGGIATQLMNTVGEAVAKAADRKSVV